MDSRCVLKVEGLWWKYQGSKEWVLKDVNLEVSEGEFLGIVGPSGAGKTTLCLALTGIIPHAVRGKIRGRVFVFGKDTSKNPLHRIMEDIGIVFQDPDIQFVTMRVIDEVVFPLENLGLPREAMAKRAYWALKVVGMMGFEDKYPFELSGGQKQRVAIASMLAKLPKILILDEPTSDLDPVGKREIFQVLQTLREEHDMTLVVVEHNVEELAKYADRVLLLNQGRVLAQEDPRSLFSKCEYLIRTGVYPPQVTEFFYRLNKYRGLSVANKLPLTPEEAYEAMSKLKVSVTPPIVEDASKNCKSTPIISFENVEYVYPDGTVALRGVDLKVFRGEFIAIIGANGSGKTTLVKHMVGILKPTKGRVTVLGKDTREASVSELALKVGYVYQNPDHQLFCTTVYDECAYALRNLGLPPQEIEERVEKVLERLGLKEFAGTPPYFLSKGQRQRLAVATVLAMKPEVIIVDEPTTGQDHVQSRSIMDLLKSLNDEGKTIVVITHDMRLVAEYAKRVLVMSKGKIIADGSVRSVLARLEDLDVSALTPPQITRLFLKINPNVSILSVEEALRTVRWVA
ncbi:MAG: hypothetical protein DRJ51_05120 [Thermoprotei archaeon]|nr:MAG: hypothetical protein DRJ51_05120 [Thermoprotei archaeon]